MSARMTHRRASGIGAAVFAVLLLAAPTASAHPPPTTTTPGTEQGPMPEAERDGSAIALKVQQDAELGESVRFEARLTSDEGEPIADALVTFLSPAAWGEEVHGDMELGTARTDEQGIAAMTTTLRRSGDVKVTARFPGDAAYEPADATSDVDVMGDTNLYAPRVGVQVPSLGRWLLAFVVAMVWALYFTAGRQALAIARVGRPLRGTNEPDHVLGRRAFLGGIAIPAGIQASLAAAGSGLVALVLRSPGTHANMGRRPPSRYRRTPLAFVGQMGEMREMPPLLEREVSFSKEVTPILLARAGPHVMLPEHSPPPDRIRLDAYDHVMNREGLVVPGQPMESMLVTVLLDPAMQMPPGVPPLPKHEIQIIASWVAQGAKKN